MALPKITIIGNTVADPILNFSKAGKPITRIRVASNENKKLPNGDWEDGASCFLDVTCFDPIAEPVAEGVKKGTAVTVTGRLQQRDYETNEGVKRTAYEVIADTVALTVRAQRSQSGQQVDPWASEQQGPGNQSQMDEPPF